MESDSTLLDEDDSILRLTPTRISPTRYSGNPKDSINDLSSSKDASNKENISINKCEGQKLNVEPKQMKKKRKGGGYNLRKSLAWDRAFFTEEGVLNPLELSMISGTDISSSREGLSTINEDDSLSNDCQSNTESTDLQALENNLFKEVPAVSLKTNTVHLPPKHSPARVYGASSSLVPAKVLPTCGTTRTMPRSGSCTRPLPSSSLKRPANVSASQAVTKESKLPRIPISRPGHSSTLLKNKIATSNVKQKQITQPAVIIPSQRNNTPKSSLKSVKHNQCKPKAGPGPLSVKASVSHSKRIVQQVNSPIYPHSFTQLNSQARNKVTDNGFKLIPNHVGSSIARPLPECLDGSSKLMSPLVHDTSTTSSTKQHKQFLSMKPSGLRMPSPSLGFFGQPKASVSHCAPQKAVRIPGYSKPTHTPVRVDDVNSSSQIVETVVLRSKSDSQAVSHERIKQNVGENSIKKELNFSNEDEPSGLKTDADAISSNLACRVLCCIENRISTGIDSEKHDLLPQQNSSKCAKGVSRPRNSTDHSLSCLQDLHHVSEEHGEIFESSGEPVRLTCGDDLLLGEKGSHCKDSHNHSSENLENPDFESPACIKNEEKSSGSSSPERSEKSEKPLLEDDVTFQSHTAKTELQMKNVISTSRWKDVLYHCPEVGYLNDFACNSLEQSPYIVQYPQNNNGEGSDKYGQEVTETLPGTVSDATCRTEIDSTDEISEVPVELQNENFDKRTVVGKALENHSVQSSVESTSLAQKHNYSVTKNVGSDVICSSEITSSNSHSAIIGNYVLDGQVNKEDRMVEDPESLTSVITSLEPQIANINYGYLLAENILHGKEHNFNLQNIPETDPTVYDSSMIPFEISNTPVKNTRQIDEQAGEEISSSILLQVENEPVQNPSCNVPVESCIGHMQLVSDQFVAAVASEISGETGLSNLCALVEKVPQFDRSSILDSLSSRERTIVAEVVGNTVFERGVDAVSETISKQVCSTPSQMHVNGDHKDIDNSVTNIVHIMPGCAEVGPSPESCRPLAGNQMKHDVEHEGLLVEDIISSSNSDQVADILEKRALPDERKANNPQVIDTCSEESHNDLDAGTCLVKDKDTISPTNRSHSSSSGTNARIILPTTAVPFSDEWLAAMEAAGEDILKMKSGAVQNSPTEKPIPEPSPWSPVRRKNNQIGPFDCTKFTNNMPSDSQ